MNNSYMSEIVAEKLAKMADSKRVTELEIAYLELKAVLSNYKNDLKFLLICGRENN